ncbi:YitT family protein [Clostridium arbusti]|uniref:YitT family protein n=1 Tax=Clostridium arbusti TaxID=1137848 RepID=UPI000289FF14|nr:YitT family protein [Clostridium arbusti]
MNTKSKEYLMLVGGTFFYSVYVALLLNPAKIGTGGILGISLSLHNLFNFKIGITTVILNIPLFLFGFKLLGKKFAIKSGLIVLISSLLIDYIGATFHHFYIIPVSDKLTASIFCGVVSGIGMAMLFMGGGSTGGLDISAKIVKNHMKSLHLSHVLLVQDICVYIFVGIVMGPQSVLYALIMSFIRSKTIDAMQEGISSSRQCIIICNNTEEIIHEVNEKLDRSVTVLKAVGGYSHNTKNFLYVVVQKTQLNTLIVIVKNIEPTAFVTVSPVNDILGNYKQKSLSV